MNETLIENRLREINLTKEELIEDLYFMGFDDVEINDYFKSYGMRGTHIESVIFNLIKITEFNDFYPLSHVRDSVDSNVLTDMEQYMIDLSFFNSI